jgi:hypothetical protein
MNNTKNSDSEDKSSEMVSTFSADFAGNLRLGKKSKDTNVYCHKSKREEQSNRVKGSNGIGENQEQELYNLVSYLWRLHPDCLAWMIIKYDFLTSQEYENLHLNWDKFCKKVKDLINNRYRKIFGIDKTGDTDFLIPWILKFELSEFRTLATGKPHFDINICLLYLDENGEPLFDEKQLAGDIYRAMSKVSGDHIPMPPDHYFEIITPFKGELRNWSSYFAKQTDTVLLARCKAMGTDQYFPKQWSLYPDSLKKEALHKETLESDVSVRKETTIALDEFKDEIEKVEENKGGAYIRVNQDDYDPTECIDRMEERLSQETDNVERL